MFIEYHVPVCSMHLSSVFIGAYEESNIAIPVSQVSKLTWKLGSLPKVTQLLCVRVI